MAASDYDLYGALPDPFLVTLKIDRNGIATAKVRAKYEAPADLSGMVDWANLGSAPRPGGLALPCSGINMEWEREGGTWKMEWDYDGAPIPITYGKPENTTYEIDCSVTTAPIETHPRFLAIASKYGVTPSNYDKKSGDFLGFPKTLKGQPLSSMRGGSTGPDQKNPLYGTSDFYITAMVYRISSATQALPSDFRQNLGLIDVPRAGGPGAPQLQGRANWLKTSARANWRGNIWQTTEEWTASGPDGWNSDVYRPA